MVPTSEDGLGMSALHFRDGVMDISRLLDQSNDLNLARGSSLEIGLLATRSRVKSNTQPLLLSGTQQ